MGIRIAWTDTNTAEDGYNVYRHTASMAGLTDAQLATYLLATLPADATEYKDGTAVDGTTYFYLVATRSGSVLVRGTEVEVTAADTSGGGGADFSTAQVGDEIEGGIYAGVYTIGTTDYHIVMGLASSEAYGLIWKTENATTGTIDDLEDGFLNTQVIQSAGLSIHPAAEHCVNYSGGGYSDWYLPSFNELKFIYDALSAHAELADNAASADFTYSSSEGSYYQVYGIRFSDRFATSSMKKNNTGYRTRPIRRVAV